MFFSKYKRVFISLRHPRQRRVAALRILNPLVTFPRKLFSLIMRMLGYVVRETLPDRIKAIFYAALNFKNKKKFKVRRFLHPKLSLEDFFKELKKRDIEYVILRWFDDLPIIKDGEDIDILIGDQFLDSINDLFGFDPRKQAFDIYSVSGISGTDYKQVPYYPPHLAQKILQSRRWSKKLYAVPDSKDHFFSLAYHVVFHKGERSGIPNRNYPNVFKSDHDYMEHLKVLAKKIGIQQSFNDFDELFELLKTAGWAPELDTMRILAREDLWLKKIVPVSTDIEGEENLLIFVVREWAILNDKMEVIITKLEESYLDVLAIKILDPDEKERALRMIRGGKWDKGPYPVSGGPPSAFIICYDYHPQSPSKAVKEIYPFIKNEHVLVKHIIRDYLNDENFAFHHTNPIHSADDEHEAWLYIQHVLPSYLGKIREKVEGRRREYCTQYPVLHLYKSNRTRAKVEKIDFNGVPAVKKTFKPGNERFAEREAFVYENFSNKLSTIPPLLKKDKNYIIIPWYDDMLKKLTDNRKRKEIKRHQKDVFETMRTFFENGFALIGFYPGNLLITPEHELKVIDFEFLYEYKIKPETFSLSYDIAGIPKDFEGDLPKGSYGKGHTYNNTWRPIFGSAKLDDL